MKPVLITTEHRGVFFGYIPEGAKPGENREIRVEKCRNCLYWSTNVKGFIGLATTGPIGDSRVGPAADLTLYNVTCIADVTPEAASVWEAAPWT